MYIIVIADQNGIENINCTETKKTAMRNLITEVINAYENNETTMSIYPDIKTFYEKIGTQSPKIIADKFMNEFFEWINSQTGCSAETNSITLQAEIKKHIFFKDFRVYNSKNHMI